MTGYYTRYREQLAYLYERSAFHREKLTASGGMVSMASSAELVPWGSLQRSEYKSTLLEH